MDDTIRVRIMPLIYIWMLPLRVRIIVVSMRIIVRRARSGEASQATRTSGYSTFSICSNDTLPPFSPVAYLLPRESPARPARRRHLDWHGCHICAGTFHICAGTGSDRHGFGAYFSANIRSLFDAASATARYAPRELNEQDTACQRRPVRVRALTGCRRDGRVPVAIANRK